MKSARLEEIRMTGELFALWLFYYCFSTGSHVILSVALLLRSAHFDPLQVPSE